MWGLNAQASGTQGRASLGGRAGAGVVVLCCGALGWGAREPSSPQQPRSHRKEILQEYYSISSLVQEDVLAVHQEITSAIQAVDPATEYSGFIQSHRYGRRHRSPSAVTVLPAAGQTGG